MDDSHRPNTTSPSNNHINDGEKMEIPNEEAVSAVSSLAKDNSAGNSVKFRDKEGVADNKIWPITNSAEDVNRESVKEDHPGADTTKSTILPCTSSWENKPDVWFPPEPEDIEDDREGSVSNIDDDDDYGDGTKWGQPSPLSSPHEDQRISHSLKEERSKAMVEAMNGQFKFLVSRFLASEGIVLPKEEEVDKGWLDIVASLSWEAALFIKPEANEGRAMDPASYVKVKCIACGSPKQSEVIKGLVFKKNIAHKHMPTKFKNPRLLLLKGVLGEGAAGLSSFNTMNQEKGFLKSVIDMIETCHPNVVLVEKNASRDVQESLLAKGIALVFDMKLQRLERIARCTGSPIISYADIGMNTNLRQCDYFHIERFVEELNQTSEGGKKTSKSLMFFEGCPKPLGCTIMLKGAHSDELKKVKRVMHYTIFAAYHLILETSFFADQRAISLEMCNSEEQSCCTTKLLPSVVRYDTTSSNHLNPDVSNKVAAVDIPLSAGSSVKCDLEGSKLGSGRETEGCKIEASSNVVVKDIYVPNNTHYAYVSTLFPGQWFPFPSVSLLRKVVEARVNQVDMDTGLCRESPPLGTVDAETEVMKKSDELVTHDDVHDNVKIESVSGLNESLEHVADANNTSEIVQKDDIDTVLDPQSILVLFSSRSILKDTACEQSHLSRIKYYGNFDMSLGRFLQDILLSKSHSCAGCGQAPTSHIYSYTHQNGKLTVQVKSLSERRRLTGEAEGKIWMWTRCLKCQLESGIPRSTKRVVMSTAARGLSFGKFLELSFSSHSAARRLSRCGHLLHRDCLRFFGLGSKVAMFRYSPVEIYAACKPPPSIEISSPVGQEWFEKETKDVLRRGERLFSDVASKLQKIGTQFTKETVNLPGASRDLSDVEAMLTQEKLEFEASLTMSTASKELSSQSTPEIFDLTHLSLELLLALYVWDCRLLSLSLHAKDADSIIGSTGDKQLTTDVGIPMDGKPEGYIVKEDQKLADTTAQLDIISIEESSGPNPGASSDKQEMSSTAPLVDDGGDSCNSAMVSTAEITDKDIAKGDVTGGHESEFITTVPHVDSNTSVGTLLDGSPDSSPVQEDESHVSEHSGHVESTIEIGGFAKDQDFEGTVNIVIEGPEDWIWSPFTDIRKEFWKDYSEGHLHKFDFIYNYIPKFLTPLNEVVAEGREKLCYPVGVDGIVIPVRDEEISSIIACASVLFQDQYISQDEKDAAKNKAELEDLQNLEIDNSTSFWSSGGSMNIERLQSSQSFSSVSSDEFSSLNSEGSLFVDRLLSSEILHPEIHLGSDKTTGKSLYSVVCIYAKQFYTLRRQCCPSELAYISSMSRCKMWDAQGGKSKALFAKTLDDRFIIKEIKKTELASFLKFAPEYFKHVSLSLSSGSQTCLAKILGVYQVRQVKGGKEVKTDLMVMENLLFGRNISRTYDLKGAVFSRYIADSNNPGAVLLDQNFIEDMCLSPMYVGGRTKHLLQRAIWNDTSFLTSINVMDYSLLVGVDKERRELVFGIIDYLRQYTWDKQLETWVKTSWVVPKNSQPTIISPKEYKKRFRKFMSKYFLTVPDSWTTQRSDSCKILTDDNDGSSHGRCTDSHENAPHPPNGVLVAKV